MLIDTWTTNSFIMPDGAKKLKVGMVDTAMPVKVKFAQRLCQVVQVASGVRLKADRNKSNEDFTICELGGVNVILGNIFFHCYEV